jgi:AmpE protein
LARQRVLGLVVFVAVPVILLQLLLVSLAQHHLGFVSFFLELLILLYALGRGNMDAQIALFTSGLKSDELQAAFHNVEVVDTSYREGRLEMVEGIKEQIFAALPYRMFERTFVVVFWFFFFGAPAALAYRLLALHGDLKLDASLDASLNTSLDGSLDSSLKSSLHSSDDERLDSRRESRAVKWLWLMEWLPARLLSLTLGLVGNFSQAAGATRRLLFSRSIGTSTFLREAVFGALDQSQASDALTPQLTSDVVSLLGRAMTTWLVIIAVLVILA